MHPLGDEPEGATPLTPEEMEGLLHPFISTRGELNELEQSNITEGLLWLEKPRQRRTQLSDAFLRESHKRLFGGVWSWGGLQRQTEKNIGVDPLNIAVDLRNLCDDALAWAEFGTYAPLEAAARFHHRLVQIHPFPNGNGRHARIMADWYIQRYFGEAPLPWVSAPLLDVKSTEREDYIAALRRADAGDIKPLLDYLSRQ